MKETNSHFHLKGGALLQGEPSVDMGERIEGQRFPLVFTSLLRSLSTLTRIKTFEMRIDCFLEFMVAER